MNNEDEDIKEMIDTFVTVIKKHNKDDDRVVPCTHLHTQFMIMGGSNTVFKDITFRLKRNSYKYSTMWFSDELKKRGLERIPTGCSSFGGSFIV